MVWQSERPTEPGDYFLSIAPEQRRSLPAVIACEVANWAVDMDGLGVGLRVKYSSGGMWLPFFDNPFFDGAQWAKRETPTDPFAAARAPVTPRAGQVWQKLNVGTKTASKAPRFKVTGTLGLNVFGWVDHTYKRMRIATLQRDWHCLNPEI